MVLFSSDLTLAYDKLIDYYRLRFQIEFNFRDAKQCWGLEDFMNVNQLPVYNAANLAMFMVNVSHVLIRHWRPTCPTTHVNRHLIDLLLYLDEGLIAKLHQGLVYSVHCNSRLYMALQNGKGLDSTARAYISWDAAETGKKPLEPLICYKTAEIRLPFLIVQ